ncbi:MAG: phosphotransferase, partial [Candidatus Bathyarchaeota archaeon]
AGDDGDTAKKIIEKLLHRLRPWLAAIEYGYRNLYEDYTLSKKLTEIEGSARDLLPAIGNKTKTFPCKGQLFTDPIQFVSVEFERRKQRGLETFTAITHGDLNARNFIVDDNKNIWLIDFSHVSRAHILKDFCKLEAEIKFCLTELKDEADVDMALDFERELLFQKTDNGGYAAFDTLNELCKARPSPNDLRFVRAWKCVQYIRNRAAVFMGRLAEQGDSASQYYLGLLHYTLRALCFEQLSKQSRTYALLSAALLCEALK